MFHEIPGSSLENFFNLFYFLLCACIIYPPSEVISAGITIPVIFSYLLGSELEEFVQYHIRRTCATLFVYSILPLGYFLGLWLFGFREELYLLWGVQGSFTSIIFTITLLLPVAALCQTMYWSRDKWKNHPISINVAKFYNNNSDWLSIISDINNEFRRFDKLQIQSSAICKIIATENWIMKVMPLSMCIAHQSDAALEVIRSDTHHLTRDHSGTVQYLNIEVKSFRGRVRIFTIRINSQDFKDLQNHTLRTITVLPNVSFHRTILEKFVDAFKESIQSNSTFNTTEVLDSCMGCFQAVANIKLQKLCNGTTDAGAFKCVTCYCKPLWCVDCMAKWFALKQDQERHDTWLSSKCTCPLCRATFCLLDVCYVDQSPNT